MRRRLGVGLAVFGLLMSGVASSAGATPSDLATNDLATSDLGTGDLPVHGTFDYRYFGKASGQSVIGAVHGVHRVPGGTVVYYSVGVPPDARKPLTGNIAFSPSTTPYRPNDASRVLLVDAEGLTAYRPLADKTDTAFVTSGIGFEAPAGDLLVAYAVFPELRSGVTTVDLQFEWGVSVRGIPVSDGPLVASPSGAAASDAASDAQQSHPVLGEGWPALPSEAQIAAVNPAAFTFDLVSLVADADGATSTQETLEEVEVSLDAEFFFKPGSAKLTSKAQARIEKIATDIGARGRGEVLVTGHTDSRPGINMDNQELSEKRATAVVKVLKPLLGKGNPLKAIGKGQSAPVASNATDSGRAKNRRVTVTYQVVDKT